VVGGPGSGKSTIATVLAGQLDVPKVELDELWWDPGWRPVGRDELRRRVCARLVAESWVVDGNYVDEIADLVWPRADSVVWLDLPRGVAVRRAVRRAAKRAVARTELWNGNRETFAVLSPVSIRRFVVSWPRYTERIARALEEHGIADQAVIRLRSDIEVRDWLGSLPGSGP